MNIAISAGNIVIIPAFSLLICRSTKLLHLSITTIERRSMKIIAKTPIASVKLKFYISPNVAVPV